LLSMRQGSRFQLLPLREQPRLEVAAALQTALKGQGSGGSKWHRWCSAAVVVAQQQHLGVFLAPPQADSKRPLQLPGPWSKAGAAMPLRLAAVVAADQCSLYSPLLAAAAAVVVEPAVPLPAAFGLLRAEPLDSLLYSQQNPPKLGPKRRGFHQAYFPVVAAEEANLQHLDSWLLAVVSLVLKRLVFTASQKVAG